MTLPDGIRQRFVSLRATLLQTYSVQAFGRLQDRITALSAGDRVIAYTLGLLVCVASLTGLYALEQKLLIVEPAYGGSLVEGEVGSPRYINPLLAQTDADRDLVALTYAGLMGLSGTGSFVPVLAESYTMAPDGKTYIFTLRKDAKFSDGTPVTANDVVFTVQKAQDAALKSSEYANWSGVRSFADNEHTVRFTLAKSYAPFLGLTTLGILPERLWKDISDQDFAFSNLQTTPVGAGPFKIQSVSRDGAGLIESIQLAQNAHYALGRPYLDHITFKFYSRNEDLASALANKTIDSAHDVPGDNTITAPYARVYAIFWNQNEKPVYARAEVRKALSLALDRQEIVTDVLGGYATPILGPVPPDGKVIQVAVPGFANPIEAAAQTLQKAGWVYDGAAHQWKNAAAKLSLDAITIRTSNVPELKNVASAAKKDWEQLGITVNVELYASGDLLQNIIRPRKYEALLFGQVIGRSQDLYAFWHSHERNDPGVNVALYANKTVDALLEDARDNTDALVRAKDLQKIEDLVAADYPAAFIYAPDFTYAVPEDLRGVALPQIAIPADRFANVASWYRVTDAVWPFFASKN